jgi:hypothetical protein
LPEKHYPDRGDDADSANQTELGIVRHFSDLGETLLIGNLGGAKVHLFSSINARGYECQRLRSAASDKFSDFGEVFGFFAGNRPTLFLSRLFCVTLRRVA